MSKIVVAMSGGVDSSVSAYLLAKENKDIVGISMQVWDYRKNGGCDSKATCCSPDDFTDARKVAAQIGVPYYVFDFEDIFREKVINNFVNTYRAGKTPNPCIDCNNKVKFKELRNRAMKFGCSYVATGHYARIEERDGELALLRGVDLQKDQSYFLYGITKEELSSTLFPVGHLTKPEVREIANSIGLATANKPESQDICFVSGEHFNLVEKLSGKLPTGYIKDQEGKILGEHSGIHKYTVGQRKGLNLSSYGEAVYVTEIDAVTNTVFVGSKENLENDFFEVSDLSWLINDDFQERTMIAQLRHRHAGVPVTVSKEDGFVKVRFNSEWATVSPGQACVFYDLDNVRVLGGGRVNPPQRKKLLNII